MNRALSLLLAFLARLVTREVGRGCPSCEPRPGHTMREVRPRG